MMNQRISLSMLGPLFENIVTSAVLEELSADKLKGVDIMASVRAGNDPMRSPKPRLGDQFGGETSYWAAFILIRSGTPSVRVHHPAALLHYVTESDPQDVELSTKDYLP